MRNPRPEAQMGSDRPSEATPPGTYTQLIEDNEPMTATEPYVGRDDDNPEVAGDNIYIPPD